MGNQNRSGSARMGSEKEKMRTNWGSCNIKAQRIWLNLELAKKSVQFLEYIRVYTESLNRLPFKKRLIISKRTSNS